MESSLKIKESGFLEEFADCYISETCRLALENPWMEEYDREIRKSLMDKFKISEPEVISLHHPFHWYLFNSPNGDSPVELITISDTHELASEKTVRYIPYKMGVNKNYNGDVRLAISGFLEKYKDFLQAKINSLFAE